MQPKHPLCTVPRVPLSQVQRILEAINYWKTLSLPHVLHFKVFSSTVKTKFDSSSSVYRDNTFILDSNESKEGRYIIKGTALKDSASSVYLNDEESLPRATLLCTFISPGAGRHQASDNIALPTQTLL